MGGFSYFWPMGSLDFWWLKTCWVWSLLEKQSNRFCLHCFFKVQRKLTSKQLWDWCCLVLWKGFPGNIWKLFSVGSPRSLSFLYVLWTKPLKQSSQLQLPLREPQRPKVLAQPLAEALGDEGNEPQRRQAPAEGVDAKRGTGRPRQK